MLACKRVNYEAEEDRSPDVQDAPRCSSRLLQRFGKMSQSSAANGRGQKDTSDRLTALVASEVADRDRMPRHEDDDTMHSETFVSPTSYLSPTIYESSAVPAAALSSEENTGGRLPISATHGSDSSIRPADGRTEGLCLPFGGNGLSVVASPTASSDSSASLPSLLAKNSPPAALELRTGLILSPPSCPLRPIRRTSKVSWRADSMLTSASPREAWATNTTRSKETDTRTVSTADSQSSTILAYVVMSVTVLVFCVVLTIVLLVTVPPDAHQTVCTSVSCAALEALLKDSVDQGKDACSDFYGYVCHGWAHSQNVSVYRSHVQRFIAEMDMILGHVTDRAQEEHDADSAVLSVYRACITVLAGTADELPAFRDELRRVGVTWPSVSLKPDLLLTVVEVYAHFGVTALLRIRRLINSAAGDMLEVAPDEGFLGAWNKTRDRLLLNGVYKRLFEETRTIYSGNSSSPGYHELRYEQFVEIENDVLAAVGLEQLYGPPNVTFLRSVDSLAAVTRNIEQRSWLVAANKLKLSSVAQVHVINMNYVRSFDEILATVGSPHLHYYMGWCVVQLMRRYMSKALASSWYDYEDTTAEMYESEKQRSQADCLQLVESLVGPLTFRLFTPWSGDRSQTNLFSMRAAILDRLGKKATRVKSNSRDERHFDASEFIVDHTLDTMKALDKAFNITWRISNSSSLLSNWMNVAAVSNRVNATFRNLISTTYVKDLVAKEQYSLFDDRKGAISLPPMHAMLPVYDPHLSDAAKFGALGTILATASFRAFLSRLPTESPPHEDAQKKLACFADRYHTDKLDLFHLAASAGVALDGLRHLRKPDRLRLHMFNKAQTFFVLMCYILCTPHDSENTQYAQVTCNEAVKNDADFPAAFECPPGSPMNPARKCNFF